MSSSLREAARVDYGLDAPALVRTFGLGGLAALLLGASGLLWGISAGNILLVALGGYLLLCALLFGGTSLLMLRSSRTGKLRARDQLLDALHLRGDEHVLDVGCGHGLLLIGAAKRLPRGRAVGVDTWSQSDQARNSRAATLANAEAEGVAERVDVVDGAMERMPFADASFDVVVASLAIHNIPAREGRRQAIGEIVRVLKPGGKVALLDFRATREYADNLRAAGMVGVHVSDVSFVMYPPVRTVLGIKPGM
ncbi:MAG: hypothetical protein OJF49_002922 [Ktedonobacterales bacterium]|jgi:SAM-dependent methyltransferase|nr:MAG: hypothetical protein OJF49_002922 [Ktedonobacterales bacterium]